VNVADHYRSTLDELTDDAPGGPDLATTIAGGRRRRRVRRTAWAGAGAAVVAVATIAGVPLAQHGRSVAVEPAGTTTYHDFVAGTGIDESLQATVARHLPGVPVATDVYPSDWNTPGPIPDVDFADATEWHATYDVSGGEQLTLLMSQRIPGEAMVPSCDQIGASDVPCRSTEAADGSRVVTFGYVLHDTTYRFLTVHVTPDGFLAEALDDVQADSWAQAQGARGLTEEQTKALVSDAELRFPAPVHTPPSPSPQL
jgi:hypothetical protein